VTSISEIHACVNLSLEGFEQHPADTPFLRGYEYAMISWKRKIECGLIDTGFLIEAQIAQACETHDPEFRAGFWAALVDVNEILYSVN
jgi:hypothetical protein